ncbi:MAG TPA: hypothetical protein PK765_07425 [bacterium]|nr:hypothetical protein [bacterium]
MQWLQHESPRDFFVRLEEATPTSHEPASLQVSMLAQALRSRGFYTILFYDDSGIGLHVAAV